MHGLEKYNPSVGKFNHDGIYRFAFAGKHTGKIWHPHGQAVDMSDCTSIEEFQKRAAMNYDINRALMYGDWQGAIQALQALAPEKVDKMKRGQLISLIESIRAVPAVEDHRLIYRQEELDDGTTDRKQISVMGDGYRPVQVREAFGVLNSLIDGGELTIETMGTLNEGRRTFIACSITGDPLEVVPGDVVDQFLLACDSYDGSLKLTFDAVMILVVCANTLRAALRGGQSRRSALKHTRNVLSDQNVDEVRQRLGIARAAISEFADFGNKLAAVKMSDAEVHQFHRALVLGDKQDITVEGLSGQARRALGELDHLYFHGPGQELEGRAGTAWGAHNSVSAWITHMKNYKGDTDTDRVSFALYGSGDAIVQRATVMLQQQYQIAA